MAKTNNHNNPNNLSDFINFVTGQTSTSKHLAGKHDQDRHGQRAGGEATPAQIAARKRVAANRAEEKKPDGRESAAAQTSLLNPGRPLPDLEHAMSAYDRIARGIGRQDAAIQGLQSRRAQMSSADYKRQMDALQKSRREMQKSLNDAGKDRDAAKAIRDQQRIAAHQEMSNVKDRRKISDRMYDSLISKIDDMKTLKNDDQFIKMDDIRDRVDRMSKSLGIDPIGPAHLRAGNAEASWKILRPALTFTLQAIRIRVNTRKLDDKLSTISTFVGDLESALNKAMKGK